MKKRGAPHDILKNLRLPGLELFHRRTRFCKVSIGARGIGHMHDLSLFIYEKTDSPGHILARHAHAIRIGNVSVTIRNQREIQMVFRNELLVALGIIETDADDFDPILLQILDAVSKSAGFLCAARSIVFGIEVKEHRALPCRIREFPFLAVLILSRNQRRLVSGLERFRVLGQGTRLQTERTEGNECGAKQSLHPVICHSVQVMQGQPTVNWPRPLRRLTLRRLQSVPRRLDPPSCPDL